MSAYYPEKEIRNALLLKNNPAVSAHEQQHHQHVCRPSDDRVPALWCYFPLVVLDPCVAKISLDEEPSVGWSVGRDWWIMDVPEEFRVMDADIVDANHILYQVRMIVHDPDSDRGMGYWGLVFDRNNTHRVLATIRCVDDMKSRMDETDEVSGFEDHKCLQVLRDAVHDQPAFLPSSETQFEMLLSFALGAVECSADHKVFPKNDFPKQRQMLKLLCKAHDGGENADNLAAAILSQSGPCQELIAQYSAEEPYVMCTAAVDGSRVDKSLDWFKQDVWELLQSWELFEKGDLNAAVSSITDWEVRVAGDSMFFKCEGGHRASRPSPVGDYFNRDDLDELRDGGILDDSPFCDQEGNLDKNLIAEYMENFVKPVTMWIREEDVPFLLREKSARDAAMSSSLPTNGDEESSSPKKKRQRRENAAFSLYFKDIRSTVKEEHPDASFGDIALLIRARFEALPAGQKKIWVDMAEKG